MFTVNYIKKIKKVDEFLIEFIFTDTKNKTRKNNNLIKYIQVEIEKVEVYKILMSNFPHSYLHFTIPLYSSVV